jgi:hypothetical protein
MKVRCTWSLMFAVLLTSGCTDTESVNAKLNPQRIPYEITITIDGAPGPFDAVDGFMQYEVTNKDCVPETGGPMNPLRLPPQADPRITFKKVADNVYKGLVYLNYFQDEDYFGLGVCHWSFIAAISELRINKLTLSPDLPYENFVSQKTVSTFFVKGNYEDNSMQRSTFGNTNRLYYKPELQSQLFSITLSAREIRP